MAQRDSNKLVRFLKASITGGLYLLLLTPMLLSSRFFFPYITTKTFYYRFLVEILIVLYVTLALMDKRYRPKVIPLSIAVLSFLGILYLTSLFGSNFYRSFWGNAERGEGLITFTHIIAVFFILTGVMRERRDWIRFFTITFLVSFSSVIYATFQKFCPPEVISGASGFAGFCGRYIVSGDVSRVSALIGNAAFYAGYLLLHVSIGSWLFTQTNSRWKRILLIGMILYELIILNYTRTRGALVGLMVAFSLAAILFALLSDKKRVRYGSAIGLALFIFLALGVYAARDSSLVSKLGGLHNVTHISWDDTTTESRLLTWKASWEGWKDRFFLGYGYENFNIAFNQYFPAKIFRDAGSQIWFDRAHNIFFDVAVSSGIFGILNYLALYGLAFWMLYKYWRRDPTKNRVTSILIVATLVGYFVQNLFVFDTLGTYTIFYSLLAFVIFLQSESVAPLAKQQDFRQPLNPFALTLSIIIMVGIAYFSVVKPVLANQELTKALVFAASQKYPETIDTYKHVVARNTYMTEEARQKLAEAVITFRNQGKLTSEQLTPGFRYAIDEMKRAVADSPTDARDYLFLMTLYNNLPIPGPGSAQEVIRLGSKALLLSPDRPQVYFEMGQAAVSLGQTDEGVGYFRKAVEANTDTAESHWNLALALAFSDRFPEAVEEIGIIYKIERIGKISDSSIRNMLGIMLRKNQHKISLPLQETMIQRNPADASLHQQFAYSLATVCDSSKAQTEMALAVALKPSLAESQIIFLKTLKEACGL